MGPFIEEIGQNPPFSLIGPLDRSPGPQGSPGPSKHGFHYESKGRPGGQGAQGPFWPIWPVLCIKWPFSLLGPWARGPAGGPIFGPFLGPFLDPLFGGPWLGAYYWGLGMSQNPSKRGPKMDPKNDPKMGPPGRGVPQGPIAQIGHFIDKTAIYAAWEPKKGHFWGHFWDPFLRAFWPFPTLC